MLSYEIRYYSPSLWISALGITLNMNHIMVLLGIVDHVVYSDMVTILSCFFLNWSVFLIPDFIFYLLGLDPLRGFTYGFSLYITCVGASHSLCPKMIMYTMTLMKIGDKMPKEYQEPTNVKCLPRQEDLEMARDLSIYQKRISIAFITDIHMGAHTFIVTISRFIKMLIERKVDIILLGGDFASCDPIRIYMMETAFGDMGNDYLKGRVFACMGQTDYENPSRSRGCIEYLKSKGVKFLIDERVEVFVKEKNAIVEIIGADSYKGANPNLNQKQIVEKYNNLFIKKFPRSENKKMIRLALIHNPSYVLDMNLNECKIDVIASGYTHGGVWGFPDGSKRSVYSYLTGNIDSGNWVKGRTHVTISNGIGNDGFPYRLFRKIDAKVLFFEPIEEEDPAAKEEEEEEEIKN